MSVKHKQDSVKAGRAAVAQITKMADSAELVNGVIILTVDGGVDTGTIVKFKAPCGCVDVDQGIKIDARTYLVVDAMSAVITGVGGYWDTDAMIAVMIDNTNNFAYIQNAAKTALRTVTRTLAADKWVNAEGVAAPYTQTVNINGVTPDSNGTIGIADSASEEQYMAAMDAQLRKTAQGTGTIEVTAYDVKPGINIQIVVQFS